jgi:hypothetical protein
MGVKLYLFVSSAPARPPGEWLISCLTLAVPKDRVPLPRGGRSKVRPVLGAEENNPCSYREMNPWGLTLASHFTEWGCLHELRRSTGLRCVSSNQTDSIYKKRMSYAFSSLHWGRSHSKNPFSDFKRLCHISNFLKWVPSCFERFQGIRKENLSRRLLVSEKRKKNWMGLSKEV